MNYIVYAYCNEFNKFYYIGRGRIGREIENHKRVKVPPKNRILILHKNLTKQESIDYEKGLIKFYGRKIDGGILENLSIGGHCGSEGVLPWNKGKKCEYISESNSRRGIRLVNLIKEKNILKNQKIKLVRVILELRKQKSIERI